MKTRSRRRLWLRFYWLLLAASILLLTLLLSSCASLRSDPDNTEPGVLERELAAEFYAFGGVSTWGKVVSTPILLLAAPVALPGWGLEVWGNHDVIGQGINNAYSLMIRFPVEGTAAALIILIVGDL